MSDGTKPTTAIQKAGAEAARGLVAAGGSLLAVSQGVPIVGTAVTVAVVVAVFGYRAFSLWPSARARAALDRIFADDDWRRFYQEQVLAGGSEGLKREVLETLRDLDAATSDEAVEPLIRLIANRKRDDLEWHRFRGLSKFFREASDGQVVLLRDMLARVLEDCSFPWIVFEDDHRRGNGKASVIAVFGMHSHDTVTPTEIEFERPPFSADLFNLMLTHGIASRLAANLDRGQRGSVRLERGDAQFILSLLR